MKQLAASLKTISKFSLDNAEHSIYLTDNKFAKYFISCSETTVSGDFSLFYFYYYNYC